MDKFTYLGNMDTEAFEELFRQYRQDPQSVDPSWMKFFEGFEFARMNFSGEISETFDREFKVINLINAYRKRGHLFTSTNPVRTRRKYFPTLDLENYDLTEADLDTLFFAGKEIGIGQASLRSIVSHLKDTYCNNIGSEYMFIRNPEKLDWLEKRIEGSKNSSSYSKEEKKVILDNLIRAVGFEKFIHKKFVGQKRFSLEGAEILIPALNHLIEAGAELGVREFTIGMAHRGRLNVLANVLQKPARNIFKEFEGDAYENRITLGDVKYHLGYSNTITTRQGRDIILNLPPNPSHLESSSPIVEGVARARIDNLYEKDNNKLVPVIIHGDSAIAGQGVVYEVIQMSELAGYQTGGTIHLVINNQVGFTTNYLDARSSTYCTDVGKVTKAPIFHVNGDDVEALVHVMQLAIEYRQLFHTDVFIDILGYRKYGHNEGDEPRFTQPLLYKAIETHPDPRDIYISGLISEGIFSKDEIAKLVTSFDEQLELCLKESRKLKKVSIQQFLESEWKDYRYARDADFEQPLATGVERTILQQVSDRINILPENMQFFRKVSRLMEERQKMISNEKVDWALGELLAYGTLLLEGTSVRVSGQDSVRGTFSHRHAGLTIEDTGEEFFPLRHIHPGQADFEILNSPLNEYGVMGFEYGYALAAPKTLNIWEAQFGDFANVAQVIIDQYISSAEEKWGVMNGLVLLLPHGFEGQGPEHSSARIERFLILSAQNNMQVINPTTPANIFHALRQQVHRETRLPLVIFTPKSLLRHPRCISALDDLTSGHFESVYDDPETDPEEVRRVVFCSGKIYYEMLEQKEKLAARDIALIRIEQLHPFPEKRVAGIMKRFKNNILTIWVQEEPENMGAWFYVRNYLQKYQAILVSRQASGSPATGLHKLHEMSQQEIIGKIFRECTCELQNKYCGLQCVIGSSRKQILKQHFYFEKQKIR